ncbi:MAG: alpha/beta hydrolase-fold protein [Planctomycetota bacterium]|nr:alpha/beta hydrolase-fold protein [Planctomycetota bacterium]
MTALVVLLLLAAPNPDKLIAEYFTADGGRRIAILGELDADKELTAEEVATWKERILKQARKSGKKLRKGGTNYFYDKKKKRGKYIVTGGNGRGGLVIALHGGGEGQGDAGGAASTFGGIASKFKCVCIAPEVLEKTERGWTTSGTEEFVLELIEAAKRTWKVPHDRVYIVGHSMGGFGSWTLGAHHADLFAGAAPYAGGPVPITEGGAKYGKVTGLQTGVIPSLRNLPLHIYQSLDDKNVPPDANVFANKMLIEWKKDYGGYNYKYVEVDGRGHGAPPGGHVVGFKWIYQFKRDSRPKHILWQPVLSYKRMFYWIHWQTPMPETLVEMKVIGPNKISMDIEGHEKTGFRIYLDSELVDLDKEVTVVEADEVVFKGKVKRTLKTMLMTAAVKYDSDNIFPAQIDFK